MLIMSHISRRCRRVFFFRFPFPRSRGDAIYPCSRTMGGVEAIQRERRGRACLMSLGLMGSRNVDCSSSKEKQ